MAFSPLAPRLFTYVGHKTLGPPGTSSQWGYVFICHKKWLHMIIESTLDRRAHRWLQSKSEEKQAKHYGLKDSQVEGESPLAGFWVSPGPHQTEGAPSSWGSPYLSQLPILSSSCSHHHPKRCPPEQVPPGSDKLTHSISHIIGR